MPAGPSAVAEMAADREHAGQQRAGEAADAVHAEHVERIVVAELLLELGAGPEAERAGDQTR